MISKVKPDTAAERRSMRRSPERTSSLLGVVIISEIPPRGWKDILLRVPASISEHRILALAAQHYPWRRRTDGRTRSAGSLTQRVLQRAADETPDMRAWRHLPSWRSLRLIERIPRRFMLAPINGRRTRGDVR